MTQLLLSFVTLSLALGAERQLARAQCRWVVCTGRATLFGAGLAALQLGLLFAVSAAGNVCASSSSRLAAFLAVAGATLAGLWGARSATASGPFTFWRAFVLATLVLSCLLAVAATVLARATC